MSGSESCCLWLFTKGFNHVISTSQTYVQRGHYQPKGVWLANICSCGF